MSRFRIAIIATAAIAAVTAGELAAQDAADVVKQRQDLMKQMGRSFRPIVAVVRGESTDFEAAASAAGTIHENALKIPDSFQAGTGRESIAETRAKPAVWEQRSEFEANARALAAEAAKLVDVAKAEDAQAFQAQFQALGKACGACHSGKGDEGGKFRFARSE